MNMLACLRGFTVKANLLGRLRSGIFNSFCHDAPASLSSGVLKSMKISTVMKCVQGSPCALHLNIKGTLSLDENVRGLEICSFSLDTQQSQCINVRFTRKKSKMLNGKKVQVQFNCIEVNVAQHIYVTMKTVPHYCEVKLSQQYYVEAGKLDYNLDRARQIVTVNVSNFPRDHDYYVRLCRKWFTCEDVGAFAVIKEKESFKSVSLKYSQLLPCLCIEGWLALPDARRIQLCPFENGKYCVLTLYRNTQVLWDNIIYNPSTQTLAWEPACPVLVMVNLCRFTKSSDHCEDIEKSFKNSSEKFTTKRGSWIKCPFAHGEFPGRFCFNHYVTGNVWVNNLHSGFRGQSYSDGNPPKAMTHRMKSVESLH
ncbi:hypothetical protein DV515_00004352 [Chloebia gouldiae]|uniref:Interleukin-17 receptor C/E N-terminal domain-containing protein n=1 Tax=Chloebia gouldiae TaxID=44316 RepID=A0A3L8SR68_CHLGU|nr:hypothetical protein DV515_00004352 [Chloebia gouldiae]